MEIDKNEFFRQATKIIASTLDIEKALERTLSFLKEVMPADLIEFILYEPNTLTMRRIAHSGQIIGMPDINMVSIPMILKDFITEVLATGKPFIEIQNSPNDSPLLKHYPNIQDYFPEHFQVSSSMIHLTLMIEGRHVAILILAAEGLNRYEPDHADLLLMLNEPFAIAASNALAHQRVLRLQAMLEDDNRFLQQEMYHLAGDHIVGDRFGLRDTMEQVKRVAPSKSPVLLYGETGTGKDVIANALHQGSPRRNKPFIKVNCGAIPENLIDSELFGHEKGAFTGALARKRGRFERAHQGTIFLDEVGELPPAAQVRLLRVLQNGEIERVGGTETMVVATRIIAATNRNLEEMVKKGTFREDLLFRLNVFPIFIPPLRERRADIPALVNHFIEKKCLELRVPAKPTFSPGSLEALINHSWPGNVRELENIVERAIILAHDGVLRFDRLLRSNETSFPPETGDVSLKLEEVVAGHIIRTLRRTGGKIHGPGGAAERLGLNPNTLRSKMKKLGIPFKRNANN